MLILLLLSSVALGIIGAESRVATADICKLPLDAGEQSDDWGAQYGYNPEEKVCETFNYGGKGGNANRYESMTECEQATKRCPQRGRCDLPLDVGEQSDDWGAQYGYNPDEKICESFSYRGRGGNENRYESMKECEQATNHCSQRELQSKAGIRKRSRMH